MALGWYFQNDLTYLLDMAKDLTKTCYEMYSKQATGLSPEVVYFNTDSHYQGPTISVRVTSLSLDSSLLHFRLSLVLIRITMRTTYSARN